MKHRLILMRHAKSSWDDRDLDDFDRPLNERGRRDAPRVGRWLKETGHLPDWAYCSPARRTQQTLGGLGLSVPSTTISELYLASPATLLKTLRGGKEGTILIIAHNPGIGEFAHRLVVEDPNHPRFRDYPTAATLVADFDLKDWKNVEPGTGVVRHFITPHDLHD